MSNQFSKKEIQKRVKKIDAVYQEYLKKLSELKKKQAKIIDKFIKELEKRKMEEIKKILK